MLIEHLADHGVWHRFVVALIASPAIRGTEKAISGFCLQTK